MDDKEAIELNSKSQPRQQVAKKLEHKTAKMLQNARNTR